MSDEIFHSDLEENFCLNYSSKCLLYVFIFVKPVGTMDWLDSDLIPILLKIFENYVFFAILLSIKNDAYR